MILPAVLLSAIALATEYLRQLPASFDNSTWAWVSYEMPAVAVIPGSFNRTIFDPLAETNVSDASIAKAYVDWSTLHTALADFLKTPSS